ncbi:3'(2'),5'-bisphosphate nucleotidase CysQ family protein [Myxacorys almedinensis]|uniref:Inositol monophosphatase family protein n=1 Tax=Myxacorys almedinensis A TaxID=2690445 RepID=A0A8J7Z1X7_9CYAN|nr:inositol monophosphatase family protein [Myxacorys almedinensis]NDJ17740.1 inositol monophosphatase family protein [Myxacorys almedinensis A]
MTDLVLDAEIRQIIRSCGQQAKYLASQAFEVSQKGPNDFVTSVDQALDRALTEQFTALFPGDRIISEENAGSRHYFQANHRLWCIDPLDGTNDFIQGDRNYSVLVGVLEKKGAGHKTVIEPSAGWIYAPEFDLMYHSTSTSGIWRTQGDAAPEVLHPVEPSRAARPKVMIGEADFANFGTLLSEAIPDLEFVRSPGSFGLKVVNAALGEAAMYVYFNKRVKIWDTVASIAIAQTAGLVCCDLEGEPISYAGDHINLETLAHQQSIVIGWASYVESLLPRMRSAMLSAAA